MAQKTAAFAFGDHVRVKQTPDTRLQGIAGTAGVIHGFTTPSITDIVPVGPLVEDFALAVYVDTLQQAFWLDPGNIELVSRPETMEFSVAGKTIRVTRKNGVHREEIIEDRPWWKFWQ